MARRAWLWPLTWLSLTACAASAPRPVSDDPFLQAFEFVQMNGGEAAGYVLVASRVSEGTIDLYAPSVEAMDRYIHVWGEERPAVPIFFSGTGAARFSGIQAAGVARGMSPQQADAWAWRSLGESTDAGEEGE